MTGETHTWFDSLDRIYGFHPPSLEGGEDNRRTNGPGAKLNLQSSTLSCYRTMIVIRRVMSRLYMCAGFNGSIGQ